MTQSITITDPDEIREGDKLVRSGLACQEVYTVEERDVIDYDDGTIGVEARRQGHSYSRFISYETIHTYNVERPVSNLTEDEIEAIREQHA